MRGVGVLIVVTAFGAAAQTGGAVSGRVTSSLHNEPVAGAIVTLRGLDDGPAQTYIAETGADGRFSIANVVPGTYEPRPSKTGYEQRTPDHFATAKDFPPITVEAGKAAAPVELRLIPDGVIAGRVVDNDGEPVRRASVETQQYGYAGGKKQLRTIHAAQTDDRGQFRLFHLPPGRYYLRVEPSPSAQLRRIVPRGPTQNVEPQTALAPAFYPGVTDAGRATELQVAPGLELDGIDVHLAPERLYSISGHIALDGPRERLSVFAQEVPAGDRRNNGFPMNLTGDQYVLTGVPAGTYVVVGQQFPGPQQKQGERQYARQKVEIVDRNVEHVDLTFSPGATIKGIVKAEGAASVKDVLNINLMPDDPGMLAFGGGGARVAADGTFTLDAAPGVYRVRVNGRQVYLKTLLVGKEAAPDRKIDTAHLAGELTLLAASDFGKVEGTVVDDAGKPVYNANVTLIPDQRQSDWQDRFRSTLTKADGKFSFAAIEPGEYKAYAWVGVEQGAPQDAEFRKPFENRAVAVKVEGNGKLALELKAIQTAQ